MEITLNLDADTLAVVQAYLEDIKFTGTPEEYFKANCDRLLEDIVKDRWVKLNKDKTTVEKVADIMANK